jgi:hypothetical protein
LTDISAVPDRNPGEGRPAAVAQLTPGTPT